MYRPEPAGRTSLLITGRRIRRVGDLDLEPLLSCGLEVERLDARGCLVVPALIDVHEHLIGGSGESGGFSTQTPEIYAEEILTAGIATVVGCLGTDTVTKTMPALLGKVKGLRELGLSAFLYTGGYTVPPATLTGSVRTDILFIEEAIGTGEVAISDRRSSAPSVSDLARVVRDSYVAGMLAGKAGVTHFHTGDEQSRLQPLRDLIEHHEINPELLYPTHVERNEQLFDEAVELTRRGATVDVDVVEEDLPKWLRRYVDSDADPSRLTASSDAAITSPRTLLRQLIQCFDAGFPIERTLMLTSTNPARVLKLRHKGTLRPEADADILVLDRASQTVRHLLANGRVMVRDGQVVGQARFLAESNRKIELHGQKN